jgi:hypothetical protein
MRKTLTLFSLAVVSVALHGQAAASPQVPDPSMTPGTSRTGTQPQASTETNQKPIQIQATSVTAELTKGVDTKRAKVGDELNAKTTTEAKLPDGTVIPKGTKLTGNVVEVAAKSKEQQNSHLVISLNRAVMKDGHDMPIHAAVTSVTAPMSTQMADMPMSSGGSAPASDGASNAGGGSTPSSTPMPTSSTAPQPDSVAGGMLKNANDHVPVGNLPNVVLSAPNTPQSAGVLDGVGNNISLQSGTKLTVNVAPAQGGQ